MIPARNAWLAVAFVTIGAASLLTAQTQAPPETRTLTGNGVELTYIDEGKGAPVVFVHGALSDLRFWTPQRKTFAEKYRFIAYTYRYHGTEPWPDDGKNYSGATHAADLAAFLTNLKAGPVHLVGLSYGGILGAIVAAEHPELFTSLTLAEPGLFSLLTSEEDKPAVEAFNKGVQDVVGRMKADDRMGAVKSFYSLVTGEGPDAFDKEPEFGRRMFEDNSRTLPLIFAAPLPAISCDTLKKITTATIVIEGARTPIFFKQIDKAVLSCIPGSRLVKIPDASHPMSADNPAAFNRAVLEFIAKR
jgi:pimeloyl-ACP methyl ester carboxylesterase